MWVYVCVYAHKHTIKHTHCTDGILIFHNGANEPRSRDETPVGPEECRWTKCWHTYIRICVQSAHVYIHKAYFLWIS